MKVTDVTLPSRSADEGLRNPVRKALQVLRLMADAPGREWGVREVSQALRLPPSTTHRILSILDLEGLVQSDATPGRYRLGLEFLRIAWQATARFPIREIALPIMREMVARCNETAVLGVYERARMEMILVASVESSHPLRYVIELNSWQPVHAGASGLVIMAFLPEMERRAIVSRTKLAPVTERTITDPEVLEAELARIRQRGYAVTHGQRVVGAVGIAAPIWGPTGRVFGDIVITVPEQRFDPSSDLQLGQLTVEFGNKITTALGGRAMSLPS